MAQPRFKLATWNVNSLRVRLPQVLDWLRQHRPGLLALQETKLQDEHFPHEAFRELGYHSCCNGQKTYNGVAILSLSECEELARELPDYPDTQRRLLAVRSGPLCMLNLYVPNGSRPDSDKYRYKLEWLAQLIRFAGGLLREHERLVVLGDLNIAPEDRDVHDPAAWEGEVLVSEPERQAFRDLLQQGLQDCFRLFEQGKGQYSWWDYRGGSFRRNHGLRIDHILASPALAGDCLNCCMDTGPRALPRPSDHCPVLAEFRLPEGG